MKRILHIILAAVMAAFCVLPASGQSYKNYKVKTDPEPLVFRKIYWFNDQEKDKGDIYRDLYGWGEGLDLEFVGGVGFDEKCFFLKAQGLDFNGNDGHMTGSVNIHILEGGFTLELKDIAVGWGNHFIPDLSKEDNSFNRTWLWRVNHNPEIVEAARGRCRELFETLCKSMDKFLEDGPPMELKAL
ncbi:MAG: hypothetical protein IJK48_09235 [Bacteroidales bacterium]|nr:hypothetical protein [Bacteroidales bacterium]